MATDAAPPSPHRHTATESTLSLIVLGLAIAGVALATVLAIQAEHIPPYWDQAWYMTQGLKQLDALRAGDWSGWLQAWTTLDRVRPSLVPLLTMPLYLLFGRSAASALYLNALMISATMLFVYLLGKRMTRPTVGLAAALLAAGYPLAVGLTRILLVETTLMALVALTLLALWASEGFSHFVWSIIAGLALGLGLLTKVFFPVFVVAPVLFVAWQALAAFRRGNHPQRRRILINALLVLGIVLVIAGPWYAINAGPMITRSVDTAFGAEARSFGPTEPWQIQPLLAYMRMFSTRVVAPAGSALFLIGSIMVAFSWRRLPRTQHWAAGYLFAAVSVTYLVFTSLKNQDPKHIVAMLPALALISSWGVSLLLHSSWVTVLLATIFLGANLLVAAPPPTGEVSRTRLAGLAPWLAPAYDFAGVLRPFATAPAAAWPLREMLEYALYVADLETLAPDAARIGIIPNAPAFEEGAFEFEALRNGIQVDIATVNLMNLPHFDVLLDKTGDAGLELDFAPYSEVRAQLAAPDSPYALLPRTFAMADGSEAYFYSRRPSPLAATIPASARPLPVEFGVAAGLMAVEVQRAHDASASFVDVTTYWTTRAPTVEPLSLFLHILDGPDGEIVWQGDHELFAQTYPSTWWQEGVLVKDVVQAPLDAVQDGNLHLRLGLYTSAGRLPATSAAETAAAPLAADAITLTWSLAE